MAKFERPFGIQTLLCRLSNRLSALSPGNELVERNKLAIRANEIILEVLAIPRLLLERCF